MATLDATVTCGVRWGYRQADEIGTALDALTAAQTSKYTTGAAANQANAMYRTVIVLLTKGQTIVDVDLRGTTRDIYGDLLEMERLRAIFFRNKSSRAGGGDDVRVGPQGIANGLTAPWGSQVAGYNLLRTGAILCLNNPIDGWAVSDAARVIRLQHFGLTYQIDVEVVAIGTRAL